jgi:cytochrome c peroxidase
MLHLRMVIGCLLLSIFIAVPIASAQSADQQEKLAESRSVAQKGFPSDLYRWVIPPDNRQTAAKVALGKELFFDMRLSEDNTQACTSCHDPAKGFTDQQPTSDGIHHQFGQRNAPTILNSMFNVLQFWDGRADTLEEQAEGPILNPVEMGMKSPEEVVAKVTGIQEYQPKFRDAFGAAPSWDNIRKALTAYERTLVDFDSPFDAFVNGDQNAISEQAKRGWSLFNGKGRCMSCHGWNPTQPMFSDNRFHNIGVSAHKSDFVPLARKALDVLAAGGGTLQIDKLAIGTDMSGLGRFLVTKQPHDIGGFRTMGLRNLLLTEPYFHDGSQTTLWDVIDHYNKGGVPNPFLDGGIVPLGLTEAEIDDLVAFLATLTSPEYADTAKTEFEAQQTRARSDRPQRDTDAALGLKGRNGPGFSGPFGDIEPGGNEENPALLGGD